MRKQYAGCQKGKLHRVVIVFVTVRPDMFSTSV